MSVNINEAFVESYKGNVMMLVQQKGSVLRPAVVNDMQVGKNGFVDQIGATAAQKKTTRHGDTPLISTPHARRRISLVDYEWADLIDNEDKVRLLIDPTSPYAENAAWAMGRGIDDEIIAAFFGTAFSGEDGSTSVTFPAGQQVAAGATGLTIAKLREARRLLRAGEVPEDEDLYIGVSAKQLDDLLATTEVASQDFNSVKALVDGAVNRFMGFQFIHTERLPVNGSSERRVPAWARTGMQLNIGAEPKVRIGERADKSHATQVYFSMSVGATRLEEKRVVEVPCVEA